MSFDLQVLIKPPIQTEKRTENMIHKMSDWTPDRARKWQRNTREKMEIMGRAEDGTLSIHNIPVCLWEREVRDEGMTEHTHKITIAV